MKYLWILLLSFILGCSSQKPITFSVDVEFTPQEAEIIIESAEEWYRATDCEEAKIFLRFDLYQEGEFEEDKHWRNADAKYGLLYKINTNEIGYEDLRLRGNYPYGYRGMAHNDNRIVIVSDRIFTDETFKEVVMHEFGHIYGLDHLDYGLMTAAKDVGPCIDSLTLREFCKMYKCGPKAAPTCGVLYEIANYY